MPKEDAMAESTVVLKQRDNRGFNLQIKLVDGRELQVLTNNKKAEKSYSIDILSLQDKSKRTLFIAWKWLMASIGWLLIMLLALKFLPLFLQENRNLYLALVLVIGLTGSLYSFILFLIRTELQQIFYSRNGHVPIIILKVGKPSKQKFTYFINAVEARVKKFRKHMNLDEEKQLTGEMKMLRRLSDDGIISKVNYEKAKAKLFSGFDSNFINRDA